jgi:hypothetical protein
VSKNVMRVCLKELNTSPMVHWRIKITNPNPSARNIFIHVMKNYEGAGWQYDDWSYC